MAATFTTLSYLTEAELQRAHQVAETIREGFARHVIDIPATPEDALTEFVRLRSIPLPTQQDKDALHQLAMYVTAFLTVIRDRAHTDGAAPLWCRSALGARTQWLDADAGVRSALTAGAYLTPHIESEQAAHVVMLEAVHKALDAIVFEGLTRGM